MKIAKEIDNDTANKFTESDQPAGESRPSIEAIERKAETPDSFSEEEIQREIEEINKLKISTTFILERLV